MTITIVTGNPGKLREWQRLMPKEFMLQSADVDLPEIQTLDATEIIADKARRAYEHVQAPVLVEDVAAGLDKWGGLPGPFIKFFEKQMGRDALFQLAMCEGEPVTVVCAVAYFDGTTLLTATGTVHGHAAPAKGENGFGFDRCFVPEGTTKTYGEMTPEEKDAISHRRKAIDALVSRLNEHL